jgi:hypothetical protein
MKSNFLLSAFVIALVVSGFSFAGVLMCASAQGTTVSSMIITSDITWTKANSPYTFTGPVGVAEGVTLTIESGVTVNFVTYYLEVNGTLHARGSTTSNIFFISYHPEGQYTMGSIRFMSSSTGWNEQTGSGSIIENTVFDSVSVSINSGSPKINNNTFGGGYYSQRAIGVSEGSSAIISNNVLTATEVILRFSLVGLGLEVML